MKDPYFTRRKGRTIITKIMLKIKDLGDNRFQVEEKDSAGKVVRTFPEVFTSREDAQTFINEEKGEAKK